MCIIRSIDHNVSIETWIQWGSNTLNHRYIVLDDFIPLQTSNQLITARPEKHSGIPW